MVTRYIYENGIETKSLMFSPKVKIIFKIENGIWVDGSKNDIILEKNYWTDLGTEELPINMKTKKGYGNGKWDGEIVFNDLKEEYEYKYIFEKLDEKNNENNSQKDIKKGDKGIINKESNKSIINPETGDKILMLIIISFLSLAVLLTYKKEKITNIND